MKTNKITLVSIIVLVLFIVVLLIAIPKNSGQSNKEEVVNNSALVSDRELHDFGEIDIFDGKVSAEFVLTNNGAEDITILAGTTSCGCTDGEIAGISFGMHEKMKKELIIPAGASENLTVTYDPLAHGTDAVGLIQRSVFLKTNSELTPELEVRIKTFVVKNK